MGGWYSVHMVGRYLREGVIVDSTIGPSTSSLLQSFYCNRSLRKQAMSERESEVQNSPVDPLLSVLFEIRQSENRMEKRLKQLEEYVQRSQEEALEKAARKVK